MMTIAAARALTNDDVCFVGIGAPSAACNLARLLHAPGITLIYESGTIGTRPDVLPLSIGDPELSVTALTTVSVPEMFAYWLQGGRISVGFLGGAQTRPLRQYQLQRDRHLRAAEGTPARRRRRAGDRQLVAARSFVVMAQTRRTFVASVDFITSFGHGEGGDHRRRLGLSTAGPTLVVTDLCLMRPHPETEGAHGRLSARRCGQAGHCRRRPAGPSVRRRGGATRRRLPTPSSKSCETCSSGRRGPIARGENRISDQSTLPHVRSPRDGGRLVSPVSCSPHAGI